MRSTIFIEGLPPGVSVQTVASMAEGYGRLSRVVVENSGSEIRPEAICWITFAQRKDGSRAMQELDGHVVGGRRVATRLDYADRMAWKSFPEYLEETSVEERFFGGMYIASGTAR